MCFATASTCPFPFPWFFPIDYNFVFKLRIMMKKCLFVTNQNISTSKLCGISLSEGAHSHSYGILFPENPLYQAICAWKS
jgi:hypothetical protein